MKSNRREAHYRALPSTQRIGTRTYVLEERVGTHGERYRARIPGKKGEWFLVHVLPRDESIADLIEVLKGIPANDKDLPHVEDDSASGSFIYVAQRWVPGRPLQEFLKAGERQPNSPHRLTVVEAVRLFNGFVHVLRRLNQTYRIIHGDLKPENLTIARNPSRLLMTDFGSAWVVERTTRRNSTDGIDFQYVAPELQIANDSNPSRYPHGDFRSDQFSASLVFYEMLTFKRPYDGAGGLAGNPKFRQIYSGSLVPPSQESPDRQRLHPRIWKAIDHAVMTGMSLDPQSRFQSFDEWLEAFRRIRIESDRANQLGPMSKAALWVAEKLKPIRRPND
jgi:serine/threonine protein kinase